MERSITGFQTSDTSTIVSQLVKEYRLEGLNMPYTMEDFRKHVAREYLEEMTPKERQEVLERLPPEQRLAGLPAEQLLKQLSAEQIEAYLRRLRRGSPGSRKKKPRPKD